MRIRRKLDLDRALAELSEEHTTATYQAFSMRLCGSRTPSDLGRADTEVEVVRIVHSKRHETLEYWG
jgi:hypothetical protein